MKLWLNREYIEDLDFILGSFIFKINKCKDITNIRIVPEDSKYYNMNWDAIIVGFGKDDSYKEEIWQRP